MALLNRFSKLNDRGETGVFTFIVTKSVIRDFHRDATTKDFCFGYHRWAVSFQRPTDTTLGVHLLLRNASANTACVLDFTLTLINRKHFSQNQVHTKRGAKFTLTNAMQGVSRWIQINDLIERNFTNETGEFLLELSMSNMTTIFECDIQLQASTLQHYRQMVAKVTAGRPDADFKQHQETPSRLRRQSGLASPPSSDQSQLINLNTNCFTFGAFDWSLTIVPLAALPGHEAEPVCRVYLNRLTGFDTLCRVKYRVILGHQHQHQHQGIKSANADGGALAKRHVDSRVLDQISDLDGRIRGFQFRNTNILKLIRTTTFSSTGTPIPNNPNASQHYSKARSMSLNNGAGGSSANAAICYDLRVHIEMYHANVISEAKVLLNKRPNEQPMANCIDRNKQAWCVECDDQSGRTAKLKLFFLDLQSVPRNHIRYISWIAYLVRRDASQQQQQQQAGGISGVQSAPAGTVSFQSAGSSLAQSRELIQVRDAPHSNYYLRDGVDLGTVMDTDISVKELHQTPSCFLDSDALTVHIEWIDSLLLFNHLYNNYDSLATTQRHQLSRELDALQEEYEYLDKKYRQIYKQLNRIRASQQQQQLQQQLQHQPQSHNHTQAHEQNLANTTPLKMLNHSAATSLQPASRYGLEPNLIELKYKQQLNDQQQAPQSSRMAALSSGPQLHTDWTHCQTTPAGQHQYPLPPPTTIFDQRSTYSPPSSLNQWPEQTYSSAERMLAEIGANFSALALAQDSRHHPVI